MPNYCWNTLKLNKVHAELVINKEGNVDFNIVRPMPESLNITCGSITDKAIAIYKGEATASPEEEARYAEDIANYGKKDKHSTVTEYMAKHCPTLYDLGKTYVLNRINYGVTDWYEWCSRNWGTKWNAFECDISKDAGDTWYCHFTTAWCPPEGWLKALAKLGVDFELTWEEESGYAGTISFDGWDWEEEEHEIEFEEED